jgi:hypothetical protein
MTGGNPRDFGRVGGSDRPILEDRPAILICVCHLARRARPIIATDHRIPRKGDLTCNQSHGQTVSSQLPLEDRYRYTSSGRRLVNA